MGCRLQLDEHTVNAVKALLASDPALGFALSDFLVGGAGGLPPRGDPELRSVLLARQVACIEDAVGTGDLGRAFQSLRCLDVKAGDVDDKRMGGILVRLTGQLGKQRLGETAFSIGQLTSLLLHHGSPHLAKLAEEEQGMQDRALCQDNAAFIDAAHGPGFWGRMLQYTTATGKHFLEHLLDTALALIAQRDYAGLSDFLGIPQAKPLHPVVFLLGWDVARESGDTGLSQKLIQLMHKSINLVLTESAHSDKLGVACALAVYQARVTDHCKNFLRPGRTRAGLMRALHEDMLASAAHPNPLDVLREHVAIEHMPMDGLLKLLADRPIDGGVARVERDRDVTIMGSFSALTAVIDILCADPDAGQGSDNGTAATLAAVREQIMALRPAEYQLEVLENTFALLFMATEDQGADAGADAGAGAGAGAKKSKTFLASESTAELVLDLVQGCLTALQEMLAGSDDDDDLGDLEQARHELNARPVPTSVPSVAMSARVARLEQYVNEAQWRLQLVTAAGPRAGQGQGNPADGAAGSSRSPGSPRHQSLQRSTSVTMGAGAGGSQVSIINRMLASPSTLLTLCLKARDFGRVDEVIEMFGMEDSSSKDAQIARQLLEVSALLGSLSNTMSSNDVPVDEVLSSLDTMSSMRMCLDLALTASSSKVACEELLDRASEMADEGGNTGTEDDAEAITSLRPFVAKLKQSMQLMDGALVDGLLEYAHPLDAASLKHKQESRDEEDRTRQVCTLLRTCWGAVVARPCDGRAWQPGRMAGTGVIPRAQNLFTAPAPTDGACVGDHFLGHRREKDRLSPRHKQAQIADAPHTTKPALARPQASRTVPRAVCGHCWRPMHRRARHRAPRPCCALAQLLFPRRQPTRWAPPSP